LDDSRKELAVKRNRNANYRGVPICGRGFSSGVWEVAFTYAGGGNAMFMVGLVTRPFVGRVPFQLSECVEHQKLQWIFRYLGARDG
jgi:hypothetical protein